MKIISSFRDYYDSAFGYDCDDSRVYKRARSVHEMKGSLMPAPAFGIKWPETEYKPHHGLVRRLGWHFGTVVIAGSAFPVIFRGEFWNARDVDIDRPDLLAEAKRAEEKRDYLSSTWYSGKITYLTRDERMKAASILRELDRFTKTHEGIPLDLKAQDLHLKFNAPVLLVVRAGWRGDDWNVLTNPCLSELGFHLAAPEVYQRIESYLGGFMAPPDIAPLSVGGDRVLAASKGFDEMSFRTIAPGHKKLQRKANRLRKKA